MGFSWIAASVGDRVKYQELSEVRAKTDYLENNPPCSSNHASYNNARDTSVDNTKDVTINATALSAVDNALNSGVLSNNDTGYNVTINLAIDTVQNTNYFTAKDSDRYAAPSDRRLKTEIIYL